ncbi:hypothetical protein [Archangium sp.]|uniref:hypothetical protein n=1 Tax=Archangium sp. TaxID=1872627 RepID=UPI002D675B83|nr:hypothetical protein [Archangium sp.]HYO57824.1 hypothetical protein [Archangium sp.]
MRFTWGQTLSRFPLLFLIPWTLIVLVFDGFLGHGMVRQLQSMRHPSVTGTITRSEVSTHSDGDGTTYSF